jgi:hypothetical protein
MWPSHIQVYESSESGIITTAFAVRGVAETVDTPIRFANCRRLFPSHLIENLVRLLVLFKTSPDDSEQRTGNDSSSSQESFMKSELT